MLRLDRNDLVEIPRPVYELLADWDGADAMVAVMVSDETSLPCKCELFVISAPNEFKVSVEHWLVSLPYFDRDDTTWGRVARACAERFTGHIFPVARSNG